MTNVNIIVAVSSNGVIGKDNGLPWKLPSDLKYFKEKTTNSVVIMGRKCYESIGKPLPNRKNIVLSRNKDLIIDGCEIHSSLKKAIIDNDGKEIFIIGGSEIYKESFELANKVYITRILNDVEGDVFLTGFDENDWKLSEQSETFNENELDFVFEVWTK